MIPRPARLALKPIAATHPFAHLATPIAQLIQAAVPITRHATLATRAATRVVLLAIQAANPITQYATQAATIVLLAIQGATAIARLATKVATTLAHHATRAAIMNAQYHGSSSPGQTPTQVTQ